MRRPFSAALAAVLAIALLSGCSLIESTVQQSVDGAIESARESIEGSLEGAFEGVTGLDVEAGNELPADFPPEVPFIDGTVVHAGSATVQGEGNWIVGLQTEATVADAFAQARERLVDAGFTASFATETGERSVGAFAGAGLNVLVTVTPETSGTIVNYAVTPLGAQQ